MDDTRIARISEEGIVENVIAAPPGVDATWPGDVLGLTGTWVLDLSGAAGVGFLFDAETGTFTDPNPPPPIEDPPAEEPTDPA